MINQAPDVGKMVAPIKDTAIGWLVKKISNELIGEIPIHRWDEIRDVVQEAKMIEKNQIAQAQSYAISHADMNDNKGYFDLDKYYEETYGK